MTRALERGVFRPNVAGVTMMAAATMGIAFAGTMLVLENEGGRNKRKDAGTQTG